MVDTPGVIWILLVVLTIVGGVAAVGIAAGDRRKQLGAPAAKALPPGGDTAENREHHEQDPDHGRTIHAAVHQRNPAARLDTIEGAT